MEAQPILYKLSEGIITYPRDGADTQPELREIDADICDIPTGRQRNRINHGE